MNAIKALAKQTLGVDLPDCYANFLTQHDNALAEDPIEDESWIQGLGNHDFVIGTTQSFRQAFPSLPEEYVVIGYAGKKLVEKVGVEIETYTLLSTSDLSVAVIDSLGKWETTNAHFLDWLAERLIETLLRLDHPSELLVVSFEQEDHAKGLQTILHDLERQKLIDLDGMVLVRRGRNKALEIHHRHRGAAVGAATGGMAGWVFGALLLHPLLGVALGTVTGMASLGAAETLRHAGMDDDFVKELASLLQPETWALFIMVKAAYQEQVLLHARGLGGKLITASISSSNKAALEAVLDTKFEAVSGP
jgi:uncharacterized membrane protein